MKEEQNKKDCEIILLVLGAFVISNLFAFCFLRLYPIYNRLANPKRVAGNILVNIIPL